MIALVLGAGLGERLRPLTSEALPKQFIPLDEGSLAQQAVARLTEMPEIERVYFLTRSAFAVLARRQLEHFDDVEIVVQKHDGYETGGSAYQGLEHILARHGEDETLVITAADTVFHPLNAFHGTLRRAAQRTRRSEWDLTMVGVPPTHPDSSLGYAVNLSPSNIPSWRFVQKPDEETIRSMQGHYKVWNVLLYVARLRELKHRVIDHPGGLTRFDLDERLFSQPFDVEVAYEDLVWRDLGTFERLRDYLTALAWGEYLKGDDYATAPVPGL